MCLYCHEALGMSFLAGALGRGPARDDLLVAWTVPFLVQEGVFPPRSPEADALAPVSSFCVELERQWAPTSVRSCARPSSDNAMPAKMQALSAYCDLLASSRARQPATAPETARVAVLTAFPEAWTAWLTVETEAEIADRLRLAWMLTSTSIAVTDEMVELWLQRRAALVLHDEEGFAALLAAYGTRCRPALVHYVALMRPLSAEHASRLRDLAMAHGDAEAAEWAAERRSS